jgi:hypothetical protein
VFCDVALEQLAAVLIIQVDDLDAVLAKPLDAAGKGAAFADDDFADAELPDQATAIPAWSEGRHHDDVAVASLAAGAAEGIDFGVNAGVALLDAAIVSAAEELAGAGE